MNKEGSLLVEWFRREEPCVSVGTRVGARGFMNVDGTESKNALS